MTAGGLIEVTGTGARNRRDYGITDAGRAELHSWLTEPGTDIAFHSAALLRVFFLWTLTREEGVSCPKDFARLNADRRAALEHVRDTAAWLGDPVQVCGRLALEFGIRGSDSAAQWADWAAEQLDEHLPAEPEQAVQPENSSAQRDNASSQSEHGSSQPNKG